MTIAEAVRFAVKSQLNILHTSMPGNIIDYDFTTQKATIQPSIRKVYSNGEILDMPILHSVPIIFPRSSDTFISFPVNAGDACLIIFSERSLDEWIEEGGQVTPQDPRQFNLSDAVALMGCYPFSDPIPLENNEDFVISHKGSTVTIKADGEVDIKTSSKVAIGTPTTELLSVVSQILSYISNPVGVVVPATPFTGALVDASAAAALKVQLDLIKGTIT